VTVYLVDSNVILDILTQDTQIYTWLAEALDRCGAGLAAESGMAIA